MQFSKKLRAIMALVLIFSMILPSYAFAGLTSGAAKPKVELVYLKEDDSNPVGFSELGDGESLPTLTAGTNFYVGIKVNALTNIEEAANGVQAVSLGIVYDDSILKAEPEITQTLNQTRLTNKIKPRMQYDTTEELYSLLNENNDQMYSYDNLTDKASASDNPENTRTLVVAPLIAVGDEEMDMKPSFKGEKPFYVAIVQFGVKSDADLSTLQTTGGTIIQLSKSKTDTFIDFNSFNDKQHYEWNPSNSAQYMDNILHFESSGVDFFPEKEAPKPAITGTVTITGDAATLKYDGTTAVTADVSQVKITGDDSTTPTLTYQWYACDDATGTNATAITGATSASFTPTKAEVGKYLKVVVTGTTNCSGTLEAIATNAVGAAEVTLTATNLAFDNKTYDGTKAATMTTGTTPTVTALGSDTVTVKFVSAEFADANVGNGKTVTAKFALEGADAAAYKLTGADGDGNVTVNDKTANITAKEISLKSIADVTGKPNEAIDLPADVTFDGVVATDTLTKGTDYTLAYTVTAANGTGLAETAVATGTTTVTPTGEGDADAKVTVTLSNTNYTFASNSTTADGSFKIKVKDKTATAIAIKTAPTNFGEVNVGDTIDLSGLVVTVTYDDDTTADIALADFAANGIDVKVDGNAITSGTTPAKSAMDGKDVVVSVATASDPATAKVGTLTVKNLATVTLTVTTPGVAADRGYNGAADKSVTSWTTEPVYALKTGDPMQADGWALDTTGATYVYADGNAGDNKVITVSGLKLTKAGETPIEVTATVDGGGNIATGKITPAAITVTAKSSLKTTATKKVSSFLDVTGLKAGDTAASVFDGDDPVNFGSENDKGFTLSVTTAPKEGTGEAVTTALSSGLTAGSYTVTFSQTDATKCANYTVTGFTGSALTVKKSSGSGSSSSTPSTPTYTVTFKAGDHGTITGATSDSVEKGDSVSSTPKVTAKEGWSFIGWSTDGKTTVDPTDVEITKNTTFTALYEEGKVAPAADHFAYIEGVGGNKFNPEGNMSRAEAATMLARLHKDFADKAADNKFSDITADSWYYNYVTFAAENGIVTGYVDGTFGPNKTITRAEFAAMLARFIELDAADGETAFSDVPSDNWAAGYIDALVEKGVVNGYNDGTFRPEQTITRAEAVKMINGAIGHTPDKAKVEENLGNYDTNFSDVAKSHWAYYEIMESATDHFSGDFH